MRMPAFTSLRARLVASVLAALAVAAMAVGALTYRSALKETEALFDYQLQQMALSLRDQGEIAPGDASALNDPGLDFVIQIWSLDGRTVYASRDHRSLPTRAVLGLADIDVAGERWRAFSVAARGRVIQVAQPQRIRQKFAAQGALASVGPLLAVAPLAAALLWWLIARVLSPLAAVAGEVKARDVQTLQPLATTGLPDEVQPLVGALNALLQRLGDAFDGQRAFVADAAHELRSPLTALRLQAQVLRKTEDPADREAALSALSAGVERAIRLVEQLLALARAEPGAAAPALAPLALAPLLRQVLADALPQALAAGSTLELQADDDTLAVRGEASGLSTLLRNLVDNALRYTPAGGTVQVSAARGADGAVQLMVDDNGPGIPETERERVFERFVRGAASSGQTGSGLGLAIVRGIADRHGARLALDTSPLGGLRVRVTFPAA